MGVMVSMFGQARPSDRDPMAFCRQRRNHAVVENCNGSGPHTSLAEL